MEQLDRTFAALADPVRRAILLRLAEGEASVNELALPFGISQPAVSRHLKVLERAGLIRSGRAAQKRPRRLDPTALAEAGRWCDRVRALWHDSFDRLDELLASHPEANEGPAAMTSDPVFTIDRLFAASQRRLWDLWTRPEKLALWFGPRGVTTTVLAHDLRPGGMLHARMDNPDGSRIWAKLAYREVVEPSRLVWVHSFSNEQAEITRAPFFDGKWPLELLTTVDFTPEGSGTRVLLRWEPLRATEEERRTFTGNFDSMRQGWGGSFDVLDAVLAEGAKGPDPS